MAEFAPLRIYQFLFSGGLYFFEKFTFSLHWLWCGCIMGGVDVPYLPLRPMIEKRKAKSILTSERRKAKSEKQTNF